MNPQVCLLVGGLVGCLVRPSVYRHDFHEKVTLSLRCHRTTFYLYFYICTCKIILHIQRHLYRCIYEFAIRFYRLYLSSYTLYACNCVGWSVCHLFPKRAGRLDLSSFIHCGKLHFQAPFMSTCTIMYSQCTLCMYSYAHYLFNFIYPYSRKLS